MTELEQLKKDYESKILSLKSVLVDCGKHVSDNPHQIQDCRVCEALQ